MDHATVVNGRPTVFRVLMQWHTSAYTGIWHCSILSTRMWTNNTRTTTSIKCSRTIFSQCVCNGFLMMVLRCLLQGRIREVQDAPERFASGNVLVGLMSQKSQTLYVASVANVDTMFELAWRGRHWRMKKEVNWRSSTCCKSLFLSKTWCYYVIGTAIGNVGFLSVLG